MIVFVLLVCRGAQDPPYRIQWESITGLPNKGLVTFVEVDQNGLTSTVVELTISYSVRVGSMGAACRMFLVYQKAGQRGLGGGHSL